MLHAHAHAMANAYEVMLQILFYIRAALAFFQLRRMESLLAKHKPVSLTKTALCSF